jgi:hypothetical protein
MLWYNSSDKKGPPPSNTEDPASGAYMFRPNGVFQSTSPVVVQVVEGPVLTEIRQASCLACCLSLCLAGCCQPACSIEQGLWENVGGGSQYFKAISC